MVLPKFTLLVSLVALAGLRTLPVLAGQFPDGTVFFERSPRLEKVTTTRSSVLTWGATYYFTVQLPADIGEPLQKLIIAQKISQEVIDFDLEKTVAFVGTADQKGEEVPLATVTQTPDSAITIIFENPIPPGTTVTVGLKPVRNPRYGGAYLFGVTALPPGEKVQGLYLGVGRLQFYDNGSEFF